MDSAVVGRKVFFLYPPSVVQDELIWEVVRREYEVYLLREHRRARALLARYPDSILFVNIDTELEESEWESYIRGILESSRYSDVRIGILSYNNDEALARKYLMDVGVSAGFVKLSLGLKESTDIILRVLEANEARGRRKYVRAKTDDPAQPARFNMRLWADLKGGVVRDISSVGMACSFDTPVDLADRTYLRDIQLKLRGGLTTISGVVTGKRRDNDGVGTIYVIMFDPRSNPEARNRIRRFVHRYLQQQIEREMAAMQVAD
ncbi:MAG: PilZ domain-containing protein [Spirochaetaceae bacterium]